MDKLRLTTVTPSKKKKQEINFKNKVKKLIVNKKITKNDKLHMQGAITKPIKVREVRILSDVTKLLLQSVNNEESPVAVDSVKGGEMGVGNWPHTQLPPTPDLRDKQTGYDVLKGEKLNEGALSNDEKPKVLSGIRNTPEEKTELSTAVISAPVDAGKYLKMNKSSTNLAQIEESCAQEICVEDLTKKDKRLKKRKRKDSGEGRFGKSLDSSSCLSDSVKNITRGVENHEEHRRAEGTVLAGKGDLGISPGFQVSDLSQDTSETRGKELCAGIHESGGLLSDVGKGASDKKMRGGRKSDVGISQGFQVSDLSSYKSERHGKEVFSGRRDSGFQVSELSFDSSERHKKEAFNGRRDSGFQVSDLSPDKFERNEMEVFSGRRNSDSRNSIGGIKKQQKGAGNMLQRKSDTEISQGFQISELSPEKSEKHGKEVFSRSRDSDSCNSISGNKKRQKGVGNMLMRKSDTEVSKGYHVSEFSPDKSERYGNKVHSGRQDSGILTDTAIGPTNGKGSNKKRLKSVGRKSDMKISQDVQISDLSSDKSEILNCRSVNSASKDVKTRKKWRTRDEISSNGLGKHTVVKPKLQDSKKRHTNSDAKMETVESEIEAVSRAQEGSRGSSEISIESEVSDTDIGTHINLNLQQKEKYFCGSKEPVQLEEGQEDSTWEIINQEGKHLVHKTTKLSKKWKVSDTAGSDVEQTEEVCILDSDEDCSLIQNENNCTRVRKETCQILSVETIGTPDSIRERLDLIREQEPPEQSYVNLEGFVQFKRSRRPSEGSEKEAGMQFYRLADARYVLLLKKGGAVHFRGKLALTVLAGVVEVLGCVLQRDDGRSRLRAFSPRGSSLLALEVLAASGRRDCKEVAVEAVAAVGLQRREVRKVEYNYEEGDSLLLLEAATSPLYAYLNQHLPGELLPGVEATEILPDKYCNKELQCTFYLPHSQDNVKTYVKNQQWEGIVTRILEQSCDDGPASCTMLCGGKGVGKSTLLRYLVNQALPRHSRVLCLDLDPGQPEFTVPGCVSAVLVKQPLLGPNYTHLTAPEKCVYLGQVNMSQCPTLYLEAVNYVVAFCRDNPEFFGIPWFVNTMGFCKGLGVELTNTVIQMVRPTDLVQIQSHSKHRNFPKELRPHLVANYQSPFRYIARSQVTVDYQFHPVSSSAESKKQGDEAEWGFAAHRLRDIVTLSYLSELVKPPTYSLTEIVPYMSNFSRLKLRICHETVSPHTVLSVLNGCLVALCCTDNEAFLRPSEPDLPCVFQQTPVCDCLGFGVIRGVDMDTKKLFLITPVRAEQLKKINCLVLGVVQLPTCVLLKPAGVVGQVPYVTVGPGQPTGRTSRKSFTRLLLAGAV